MFNEQRPPAKTFTILLKTDDLDNIHISKLLRVGSGLYNCIFTKCFFTRINQSVASISVHESWRGWESRIKYTSGFRAPVNGPWSLISRFWLIIVENPKHSDFVKLRTMLISTHMQDLKDVTQDVHYENFRAQCISQISQQAIRERRYLRM